jgi:hypothetical protein
MSWLRTTVRIIAREAFGLFVDDGPYAVAILLWLALAGLGGRWLGVDPAWLGVALFAGLAVILVVSAAQRAWRGNSGK